MKKFLAVAVTIAALSMFSVPSQVEAGCGGFGSARQAGAGVWYPGKNIRRVVIARRANAQARDGWYLGKYLGR